MRYRLSFLAVDRVMPEQTKRFEEEVRQHVEEESKKQRYGFNEWFLYHLYVIRYKKLINLLWILL